MLFPTEALARDHREMEAALDCLAGSLASASLDIEAFRRAHRLCIRHYASEEAFLIRLGTLDAALAAKLRGQHEEALELAARLEEALAAGQSRDGIYLARRFLAIAQHNIIEEERDVFPLAPDIQPE